MIHWAFSVIAVGAIGLATFSRRIRSAILALWVAGLAIGAVYLTLGAELLAIVQWIVSTIVAISFVFFAVMFGEYSSTGIRENSSSVPDRNLSRRGGLISISAVVLGSLFPVLIWLGSGHLPESMLVLPTVDNDLASLGRKLAQEDFIALEVLALTLFLVLVGGGVIARPEGAWRSDKNEQQPKADAGDQEASA